MSEISAWFAGRLPDEWFVEPPEVTVDREEILVVGRIPAPELVEDTSGDAEADTEADTEADAQSDTDTDTDTDASAARSAAEAGRIKRWREETRRQRMRIADEAEYRFGRKVAWGAACGDSRYVFTNLSIPVMTRLRQRERMVLDTLVEAGIARSRSEALAWTVRLVGKHQSEWISDLREALAKVEEVREAGPQQVL
ncbi:MAG TPA: hypothetical protein VFJ22_14780 [Dermatophilaceae bacterium]|nr:hypothetical protein [Dermatophilaceae bacterium]